MKKKIMEEGYGEREKAEHGDIFLPVNSYHCLVPLTYTELALHWHEEMEITLIRQGMSDYRVGQETFLAQEGDLILVPPYCTHSAFEIPGRTMVSDSLVFHLDFLGAQSQDLSASRYLRPLMEGKRRMSAVIHPDHPGYEQIRDAFLGAWECFRTKPPFYEIRLKKELLQVVIFLLEYGCIRDSEESQTVYETRRQLKNVLAFVAEHYNEKIKVADLARMSGFSESYFMSFFHQYVGMSCIRYINHYRIQKAAQDLEKTQAPVMEVALNHGFENISYFNLQFRRQFGMTPGEFRTKFSQNPQ